MLWHIDRRATLNLLVLGTWISMGLLPGPQSLSKHAFWNPLGFMNEKVTSGKIRAGA